MFGSNFKKFNSVLILFLVYISLKNISKFTEDDIIQAENPYMKGIKECHADPKEKYLASLVSTYLEKIGQRIVYKETSIEIF